MMTGWDTFAESVQNQLAALKERAQWRFLSPLGTPDVIDLTHNDYLGLRGDSAFQSRCRARIGSLPAGSGASRLLGGEWPVFREVETAFAAFKRAPDALYFASGYAANEAVYRALDHADCHFFSDALNHASIIDGLKLARLSKERLTVIPHGDLAAMESALSRSKAPYNVVAIEALFSMDGDSVDLPAYLELCRRHRGVLVVDEAHSLGIYGKRGSGLLEHYGIPHQNIVTVNPCGKAMAAAGAFICGPGWLRDYLINTARSFIFSTGPSPWVAAALLESIATVEGMQEARTHLKETADEMRRELKGLGFDLSLSNSHIIPLILGGNEKAIQAAEKLESYGIRCKAIRPPTVPDGAARLRLSLHAALTNEDAAKILQAVAATRSP